MRHASSGQLRAVHGGAIAAAVAGLLAMTAEGSTLSVPGDEPTIAQALARARRGDIVLVSCGTYREHDLIVPVGVSLWSGTLQADCVIIDAGGAGRVLVCDGVDSSTTIVGFTLTGGRALGAGDAGRGGAVYCRESAVKFANCELRGNTAREGGALACVGNVAPTLDNCRLVENEADRGGAVAWLAARGGRLSGCELRDNQALEGGGLLAAGCRGLMLARAVFTGNSAGNVGGACLASDASLRLAECLLADNTGGVDGGALAILGGDATFVGCTIAANRTEPGGGAVLAIGAMAVLERCLIAFNGGAEVTGEGPVWPRFSRCDLYGNAGSPWSGALADQAGRDGNFSLDPKFCNRDGADFRVRAGSPCLPGNQAHGADRPIGAYGVGCGAGSP